jgi:hypothetical protein
MLSKIITNSWRRTFLETSNVELLLLVDVVIRYLHWPRTCLSLYFLSQFIHIPYISVLLHMYIMSKDCCSFLENISRAWDRTKRNLFISYEYLYTVKSLSSLIKLIDTWARLQTVNNPECIGWLTNAESTEKKPEIFY